MHPRESMLCGLQSAIYAASMPDFDNSLCRLVHMAGTVTDALREPNSEVSHFRLRSQPPD
jgi:hypothetical protein